MDKQQAYYSLWSNFNIPAYDELSVPDGAVMPYITYQVMTDSIDKPVFPTASLWYRGTSWEQIDLKLAEVSQELEDLAPIALDKNEFMYVTKGTPFAQRMAEETDRTIKRYVLNLSVEFFTKY